MQDALSPQSRLDVDHPAPCAATPPSLAGEPLFHSQGPHPRPPRRHARDGPAQRVAPQQQHATVVRWPRRRRRRARPSHPRLNPSMGSYILVRGRHPHTTTHTTKYSTLQATAVTLQAWTQMGSHTIRRTAAYERTHRRPSDEMASLYAERTSPAFARPRRPIDEPGVDGG